MHQATVTTNNLRYPRTVRSYVARGRLTSGQRRALERYWPRYGIEGGTSPLQLEEIFGRRAPCHLEIGFGMGEALLEMATSHPEVNHLGIEVYLPGIGSLLKRVHEQQLHNLRILNGDACELLDRSIPDASFEVIQLFFPDPWPKKRHHKRRIVQPPFAALLAQKLLPGGRLLMATDWQDYAEHMLQVLSATPGLVNTAGPGRYAPRPAERPLTKFEARGQRLGHPVWDLVFVRTPGEQ